jgi:hypothetical protein
MGSFYSLVNNLISNISVNDHDENTISKPCGQSGCCSLYPHLQSISPNMTIQSPTSSIKRNQRRSISKPRTRK